MSNPEFDPLLVTQEFTYNNIISSGPSLVTYTFYPGFVPNNAPQTGQETISPIVIEPLLGYPFKLPSGFITPNMTGDNSSPTTPPGTIR
jgi:hypothetical protein